MRKLSPAAPDFPMHSGLARIAITEVGLTKGFREKDKMVRTSAVLQDGIAVGTGEYDAYFDEGVGLVMVITAYDGFSVQWCFTWPDLKLDGWLTKHAVEEISKSIPEG